MSDDRARARRMMRLSELHARARQWQEDPTQDDAAAEFERTGRLPEEFSAAGEPNRLRMEESFRLPRLSLHKRSAPSSAYIAVSDWT